MSRKKTRHKPLNNLSTKTGLYAVEENFISVSFPQSYEFSGKRVKRGLHRSAKGIEINADVNGAANILKKSRVVSLEGLYCRGELSTPIRIRVA